MKKILVVHYSQTGQLTSILKQVVSKIEAAQIDFVNYEMERKFPFPWNSDTFFNEMPETVLEIPEPIVFNEALGNKYDLIVLGYQPWFLSPSLPTSSLFANEDFQRLLKDTPVLTIIGARNMWLNSQESIKQKVKQFGGRLVGNIVFVDKNGNLPSAVSILHWMLTGKKDKKWGIFPIPGISEKDINESVVFGELINNYLLKADWDGFQEAVIQKKGITVNTNIMFIEGRAKFIFKLWANLIKKKEAKGKSRLFWVRFFKYYLVIALFLVAPIVLFVYNILIRPFTIGKIKEKKKYFCSIVNQD